MLSVELDSNEHKNRKTFIQRIYAVVAHIVIVFFLENLFIIHLNKWNCISLSIKIVFTMKSNTDITCYMLGGYEFWPRPKHLTWGLA